MPSPEDTPFHVVVSGVPFTVGDSNLTTIPLGKHDGIQLMVVMRPCVDGAVEAAKKCIDEQLSDRGFHDPTGTAPDPSKDEFHEPVEKVQ